MKPFITSLILCFLPTVSAMAQYDNESDPTDCSFFDRNPQYENFAIDLYSNCYPIDEVKKKRTLKEYYRQTAAIYHDIESPEMSLDTLQEMIVESANELILKYDDLPLMSVWECALDNSFSQLRVALTYEEILNANPQIETTAYLDYQESLEKLSSALSELLLSGNMIEYYGGSIIHSLHHIDKSFAALQQDTLMMLDRDVVAGDPEALHIADVSTSYHAFLQQMSSYLSKLKQLPAAMEHSYLITDLDTDHKKFNTALTLFLNKRKAWIKTMPQEKQKPLIRNTSVYFKKISELLTVDE